MKKITILLFIVIITSNAFSQEIQFSAERLKYFHYTNLAELAICKGDYKNAIALYDSALCLVNNPGYRNLYNLALCYKNAGIEKQADSLFVLLLSKGYGKSYIGSCYDTLKNIIPKKEPILINGIDLDQILREIFRVDQKANSVRYQSMESYTQVVIGNAKKIMSLTQEIDNLMLLDVKGYLYFPMIHFFHLKYFGEKVKSDSIFRKQYYVYRCLENVDFDSIKFLEFLREQVAKGNYDQYNFTSLLSFNGWYNFGTPVTQFDEYIVIRSPEVICKDKLKYINSTRKSFALESYEDFFKKARFKDSLITNGKPFTFIPFDRYDEKMREFEGMCNFQIVKDYRFMMGFSEPEDAKNAYEKELKKLCTKEDNL